MFSKDSPKKIKSENRFLENPLVRDCYLRICDFFENAIIKKFFRNHDLDGTAIGSVHKSRDGGRVEIQKHHENVTGGGRVGDF